jgi:8-oxo-dGTP pyrophosphatase MutT (NUDIX family)
MEVSSGGIVVRKSENKIQVLLVRRNEDWQLPKGLAESNEKFEETALREVREETGINAKLMKKIGKINYWYRKEDKLIYKVVHFFLMESVGGNIEEHNHEMDEVKWFPIDKACEIVSFKNERDLIELLKKEVDLVWGNWSL